MMKNVTHCAIQWLDGNPDPLIDSWSKQPVNPVVGRLMHDQDQELIRELTEPVAKHDFYPHLDIAVTDSALPGVLRRIVLDFFAEKKQDPPKVGIIKATTPKIPR